MRSLRSLIVASCLLATTWASACLWDYDTLAAEANGKMDYVEVIVGRFDRFPPLYYEMRLGNCIKQIDGGSKNLDLYDNAAVACDRLGRDDEAIKWIEKKRSLLPGLAGATQEVKDQWYRYYANVGTFWAHRWFASGAKAEKLSEIDKAVRFITKAIEVNPNAHFGREKVQLEVLKWVRKVKDPNTAWREYSNRSLSWELGLVDRPTREIAEEKALGLSGLIRLGNAWESVDIFRSLCDALRATPNASLAQLSFLRSKELENNKKVALDPAPYDREDLMFDGWPAPEVEKFNIDEYRRLRLQADNWQERRTEFILQRLKAGRHPDWDRAFFEGWATDMPLTISEPPIWTQFRFQTAAIAALVVTVIVVIPAFWITIILYKHFRAKRNLRKV